MKIVIISQVIYPRLSPRSFRATELAKYFASQGHDVYLYAVLGAYDYSQFEAETGVHVCSLGKTRFITLNSDGVIRNSFFDRIGIKLFQRSLEYPDIELTWKTYNTLKNIDNIDLLITIAVPYPIHWGAAFVKKRKKESFPKVWISDCGDPYMGDSINKKHPRYFQILEDFWGKQTDFVTIPIEGGREGYSKDIQDKIRIIPQGFDFNSVKIDTSFKENAIPHFAYTGTIFPGYRDPTNLLHYLCSLNNVDFRFVVYTKQHSFYAKFKESLKDKLVLKNYVPREQLIYELSQMDFLINLKNESCIQSPSKLIDFYLSSRPIIDITTSFSEQNIFDEFIKGSYIHRHMPPDITQYDIRNVGAKFLELYTESCK